MIELEERLRSALAGLAEELPPSPDPLVEQRRRQVRRRRPAARRPMLAAAAAAVVAAIGVIPAAITHDALPGGGTSAGQFAPPSTEPRRGDPSPDGPYQAISDGPYPIGEFTEGDRTWSVLTFLERYPVGSGWAHRACAVAVTPGATPNDPNRHPASAGCTAWADWPTPNLVHTMAALRGQAPGGGPLANRLLFLAAPEVARLEVREAYGQPVRVTELARQPDLALYVAEFPASSAGFGYTARDASGAVLESGIS